MAPKNKFLGDVKGFTPVIDALVQELGLIPAVVYGVVWRYCQMDDHVCRATLDKIARRSGVSYRTALRHIKRLCQAGYLEDTTPDKRNRPHTYKDTGRAQIVGLVEARVAPEPDAPPRGQGEDSEDAAGMTQSQSTLPQSHSGYDLESHEESNKKEPQKSITPPPSTNLAGKDQQSSEVDEDDDSHESKQQHELNKIVDEIEQTIKRGVSSKDKAKLAQSLEHPTDMLISLLDELTDEPISQDGLASLRRWCAKIEPQPEPIVSTPVSKAMSELQAELAKHRAEPLADADIERLRDAIQAVAEGDHLTIEHIRAALPQAAHYGARSIDYVIKCAESARDAQNRQSFGETQRRQDEARRSAGQFAQKWN